MIGGWRRAAHLAERTLPPQLGPAADTRHAEAMQAVQHHGSFPFILDVVEACKPNTNEMNPTHAACTPHDSMSAARMYLPRQDKTIVA